MPQETNPGRKKSPSAARGPSKKPNIDLSVFGKGYISDGGIPPADPNYEALNDEGLVRWKFRPYIHEAPGQTRLGDVRQAFDRSRRKFEISEAYHCLKASIILRFQHQPMPLTNYICFGTGCLTVGDEKEICMSQLAVFVAIAHLLHRIQRNSGPPQMFAQDPVYNTLDKRLLELLKIRLVEHPEAFSLVDGRSLAFGPLIPHFVLRGLLFRSPAILMVDQKFTLFQTESDPRFKAELYSYFPEDFPDRNASGAEAIEMLNQNEIKAAQLVRRFMANRETLIMPEFLPAFNNPVGHGETEITPLYIYLRKPSAPSGHGGQRSGAAP